MAKVVRKPLGDLTNTKRPRTQQKLSKKNCLKNVSAVSKPKVDDYDWVKDEGFLHNHGECMEAQRQSVTMSTDYFLETVGPEKDSSVSSLIDPMSGIEIETHVEPVLFEIDICAKCAPASPPTPTPRSPWWITNPCLKIDWDNMSPFKMKDF